MADETGGSSAPIPLLTTKLHVPAPRVAVVDRPSLWDRLDAGLLRPLTVVVAPAGSGKTLTLASWLRVRHRPGEMAWLSLDRLDNDVVRFWGHLLAALATVDPALVEAAGDSLTAAGSDPDAVVGPLVEALAARREPVVLVLDDYHLIDRPEIHASLGLMLDRLPDQARLVVASRSTPELALAARRVRGELSDLGAEDLSFDEEEVETLLASFGVSLPRPVLDRLVERTEGWAAGTYLAALSLREADDVERFVDDFSGADANVFDYLATEVLDRQPPELRSFLLRTSVLERLGGELCDAVLEREGSQLVIERLARGSLFVVPLDSQRRWYRYHHLFGDFLARELDLVEPGRRPSLHGRAGEWYRRHGNTDAAITHLIAAGRHGEATDLILAEARTRFHHGQWMTVQRWIESLPPDEVVREPRLLVSMAWAAFVGGLLPAALHWLVRAEEGDTSLVTPVDGLTVAAEIAILRSLALRSTGDFPGARTAAEQARELTDDSGVPRRFVAYSALGMAQYWAGEPEEARTNLETALPHLEANRDRLALAEVMTLGHLAAIELDRGDVEAARRHAAEARGLAAAHDVERCHLLAMAVAVEGRLAAYDGRNRQAEELDQQAIGLLGPEGDLGPRAYALLSRAQLAQREGDPVAGQAAVKEARRLLARSTAPGLQAMVDEAEQLTRRAPIGGPLTGRELDLLLLLPGELSRRGIAEALDVSIETVKTHTRSIYRKLGVSSRAEAVERARQLNLLPRAHPG